MMFYKVLIFITICAVDSRTLVSEIESEQKIPTLRNNEHVVFPLIYKYAKLNQYSALKSILRSGRSAHPNLFQELQYAPLYHEGVRLKNEKEDVDERDTQNTPTPTATSDSIETTEFIRDEFYKHVYKKSHLEPRPYAMGTKYSASGNMGQATMAVTRSPGYNVVYTILPESIQTQTENKSKKFVDYVKPIGINLNLESLTSTMVSLVDVPPETMGRHLQLGKQHFFMKPIEHLTLKSKTIQHKRYLAHNKYHRLHLNIARVYSPGQLPQQRPPVHVRYEEAKKNFHRRTKYASAYFPQAHKDISLAHNTMLHPVKRHRKRYHMHMK